MIFITVGTHEQGMDRLFEKIDELIELGKIDRNVFAQIGYTNYSPKNFKYKKLIDFDEMDKMIKNSQIVITHGGPGSIFHALQYNKIPIVIPRNPIFNEHIDDHQILFTKRLEEENKIIAVYDTNDLYETIKAYEKKSTHCIISKNNTSVFIKKLNELMGNKLNL